MKTALPTFGAGILFGFGLCLSQMVNPQVVLGFLDIFGYWDARLAFVMLGALCVSGPAFYFIKKQPKPVCGARFEIPGGKKIDMPLITGAVLFGIGWGLAGICPGPAITALPFTLPKSFVFAAAMFGGMGIFHLQSK